jgi:hypothetical protein
MRKRDFKMRAFYITLLILNIAWANECISCHKQKELQCKKDIHNTLKNSISLTLKAWGIKDYNRSLQNLPAISSSNIKEPKDLAIDFLRRKCLRCHLKSKEINPTNNRCLACHNKHSNKLDAKDAKAHMNKCLKCHNSDFIGTDFLGKFPKDFDKSYKAPLTKDGLYPKKEFRSSYHQLIEDVHYKKGFSCISCHQPQNSWKIDCTKCHQNITTKNHPVYHKNISCIACHSAWQVNSYNRVLLRSDIANYKDFKRLKSSEDLYLEDFLNRAIKSKNIPPQMPDFVDNSMHKGVWYMGYRYRRWEDSFLVNYKGKIESARALLDFELTYINEHNKTIIDSKKFGGFTIAKPHTIIKEAKSCKMCHENNLNLNRAKIDSSIKKGKLIIGKPLNKSQIEHLQSNKYRQIRAMELFGK